MVSPISSTLQAALRANAAKSTFLQERVASGKKSLTPKDAPVLWTVAQDITKEESLKKAIDQDLLRAKSTISQAQNAAGAMQKTVDAMQATLNDAKTKGLTALDTKAALQSSVDQLQALSKSASYRGFNMLDSKSKDLVSLSNASVDGDDLNLGYLSFKSVGVSSSGVQKAGDFYTNPSALGDITIRMFNVTSTTFEAEVTIEAVNNQAGGFYLTFDADFRVTSTPGVDLRGIDNTNGRHYIADAGGYGEVPPGQSLTFFMTGTTTGGDTSLRNLELGWVSLSPGTPKTTAVGGLQKKVDEIDATTSLADLETLVQAGKSKLAEANFMLKQYSKQVETAEQARNDRKTIIAEHREDVEQIDYEKTQDALIKTQTRQTLIAQMLQSNQERRSSFLASLFGQK